MKVREPLFLQVLFKKLIRHVTMGQLSIFLTLVGVLNVLLLWPIGLTLYLIEGEVIVWTELPYAQLGGSAVLFIGEHISFKFINVFFKQLFVYN